jgi:CheY-like chemotaxis protein
MPLFWPRNRAKQAQGEQPPFPRGLLALERLEDRCLLSAKPLSSESVGLFVPDQPGKDLPSSSLQVVDPGAPPAVLNSSNDMGSPVSLDAESSTQDLSSTGMVPLAPLALINSFTTSVNAPMSSLAGLTLIVSSGGGSLGGNNNLLASPQDDGSDVPTSLPLQPNTAGNVTSQNTPVQALGDNLSVSEDSGSSAPNSLNNLASGNVGQQVTGWLGSGNLSTDSSGRQLHSRMPYDRGVGSGGQSVSTQFVSSATSGSRASVSNHLNRQAGLTVQAVSSAAETIKGISASLGRAFSDLVEPGDGPVGDLSLLSGNSTTWGGAHDALLTTQEALQEPIDRWLRENWVAHNQETPLRGASGYPASARPRDSFNPPAPNLTIERPADESGPINGTDPAPQIPSYPIGVAIATHAEVLVGLSGRENELIDKPITSTGTLATALPVPSMLPESGSVPTGDFGHGSPAVLSFAATTLLAEPEAWSVFVAQGSRVDRSVVNSPVASHAIAAGQRAIAAPLKPIDSRDRFELFQADVGPVGPTPGDLALPGTTGPTSIYLAPEESSVWSILTTYALVLMPRQRRHQPTILVVDPDDATREALNVVLVREGYFVLPAASVRDAWGMFRTPHVRIDLVLLDPHLPDVSGIHLCARLRELSPTLPVMVCAGDVEPSEVAQLQQLGVRYYLRKPIAPEELLHTVKAILP